MPASDRYGTGGGYGDGGGYGGGDGGDPSSPRNGASPNDDAEAASSSTPVGPVVPPPGHADIFASAMAAAAAAEHDSVSMHSSASSETYGSQKSGYSGDSQTPISINHIKGQHHK